MIAINRKKQQRHIHTTWAVENLKLKKKKTGLNGIQTIDLCDTGAVVPVHSNGKTMIFKLNWKLKQEYLQLEYGTL